MKGEIFCVIEDTLMAGIGFPIEIKISENFAPFHFLFEVLAFYIAFFYYHRLRKSQKDHYSNSQRLMLIIAACFGALLGSRLLAAAESYEMLSQNFSWFTFSQSKTIVGGIIGGWIGIELIKKFLNLSMSSGDLFTFPLILGIMVGRIGCALTGVSDGTAGVSSSLPWAFDQGDGIARHPTALYEILFLGILWGSLHFFKRTYTYQNGDIFRLFMVGYSFWRLCVEFIKPVTPILLGFSAIQIACLLVLLYYFIVFAKRFRNLAIKI